jgi:hypothetical protein
MASEGKKRKQEANKQKSPITALHGAQGSPLGSIEKGVRGDLSEVVSRITSKQEHSKTKE